MRWAALAAFACIACGRLAFEPSATRDASGTSDASGGGSCVDLDACEDGDPCTTGDRCVMGVCGGGEVTACAGATRDIFRSAGTAATPLVAATGPFTITGTTAVFAVAVPPNVGVGDVIEYDANDDGVRDSLAFIYARQSALVYLVRDQSGGTPVATAGTANWRVYRAYTSLAAAVDRTAGGTRNPNITAATFDGYSGGRDLVAADERWHVACYDDAVDTLKVEICNTSYTRSCTPVESWTTDATHFLDIFTPVVPSEVGSSQRHMGTATSGYRRTSALIMYQGHVRIDGLSLLRSTYGIGRSYYVETQGTGGEVWISNSFGWNSIAGDSKVYDIWDTNLTPVGTEYTVFKLWNDIGYNETPDDPRGGFYINSDRAEAYVYACTSYVKNGGAFGQASLSHATIKNSVGFSEVNAAYLTDDGFQLVESSASNDASLTGIGTTNLATAAISFVDAAAHDLHLAPNAAAVRGIGVDLSADPTIGFSTDIDGDARPAGGWDLGADQVAP